jgi:transcriptional regulator with XRE-family HTH domain
MTPADRLGKWGRLLWGEYGWQSAMARALGMNLVTLQRYISGARRPTEDTLGRVEAELRTLARARMAELRAALE